jgi:hypothetical protein
MDTLTATHVSALKLLRADTQAEDLSADTAKTIAAMDARYVFNSTRNVLTMLRKVYPDNKVFQTEMQTRRAEFKKLDKAQEPTDRQLQKHIPWDDIIAFRDLYFDSLTSDEQLLISLYTMVPPARADYTPMKIVGRKPSKPEDGFNYLVLRSKTAHFLFHAFKTHATLGDQYIEVPKNLNKVIRSYIKEGQTYLLEHDGKPWTEAQLGVGVRKIFQRYLDMDTGITTIRHSYITKLRAGEPSIAQNTKIANSMMHSVETSQAYRFLSLE